MPNIVVSGKCLILMNFMDSKDFDPPSGRAVNTNPGLWLRAWYDGRDLSCSSQDDYTSGGNRSDPQRPKPASVRSNSEAAQNEQKNVIRFLSKL